MEDEAASVLDASSMDIQNIMDVLGISAGGDTWWNIDHGEGTRGNSVHIATTAASTQGTTRIRSSDSRYSRREMDLDKLAIKLVKCAREKPGASHIPSSINFLYLTSHLSCVFDVFHDRRYQELQRESCNGSSGC